MNTVKLLIWFCLTSINRTNPFGFGFISRHREHHVLIPIAEMAKMAPGSSSHSFAVMAPGRRRRDFPVSGRRFHGEAKYTRAQVLLSTPLGEGAERPGTARQRSWGQMLPTDVAHSWRMQRLGRLYTWSCTLGLAKLGATSWGKLLAADPTARWDLLFWIIPHLAASAAFFPLATVPLGPAGLVNFSEVWGACVFAAAVNSVLFGEVLLVPLPPLFLCSFFFCCLSFLPFLCSYHASVPAQSNVCLAV